MQDDSKTQQENSGWGRLVAICNYCVICGEFCVHAKPHIPLYKGYMEKSKAPSSYQYHNSNCVSRRGRTPQCPPTISQDRQCIALNAEEVAEALAKMALEVKNEA